MLMQEPQSKCYIQAIRYLSRYPKTEKELSIYLLQKWYLQDEIDNAMDFLKFKRYIDDAQFVELYFNSEVIKKWRPLYVATNKLYQKGVDKSLVDQFIQEHKEEIEEGIHNKIRKFITQYKNKWVDGFDVIQKIMNKWYKLDDIKAVINNTTPTTI